MGNKKAGLSGKISAADRPGVGKKIVETPPEFLLNG
jgi:hypothetical protein